MTKHPKFYTETRWDVVHQWSGLLTKIAVVAATIMALLVSLTEYDPAAKGLVELIAGNLAKTFTEHPIVMVFTILFFVVIEFVIGLFSAERVKLLEAKKVDQRAVALELQAEVQRIQQLVIQHNMRDRMQDEIEARFFGPFPFSRIFASELPRSDYQALHALKIMALLEQARALGLPYDEHLMEEARFPPNITVMTILAGRLGVAARNWLLAT